MSAARDPGPGGVPNRKSSRERVPIRPAMSMEKTIFIGDTGRTLHAVKHDMHAGQATTARRELMQYLSQKTSIVQNVGQELAISDTHASGAAGQWLQGCTISVDVRSDDGVVAGSLYEEMLALMGAKVLSRINPCDLCPRLTSPPGYYKSGSKLHACCVQEWHIEHVEPISVSHQPFLRHASDPQYDSHLP